MGYSSSDGGLHFIQAYNRSTSAFTKLVLNNSIDISTSGKVGVGTTNAKTKMVNQKATLSNLMVKVSWIFIWSTGVSLPLL